jgi:hypothetical protein
MSNKNLFKEAIADAKAVREAALANAKAALEEALTPKLQSMLAAKLQEMEGDEEELDEAKSEEEKVEEGMHPDVTGDLGQDRERAKGYALEETEDLEEDFDLSEILAELEDDTIDEAKEEDEEEEEESEEEETEEESSEEEVEDEEEIEVKDMSVEDLKNLIKDIVSQEVGGDEMSAEEPMDMDLGGGEEAPAMGAGEEEIDLEELLAELDALDEADDEEKMEEAKGGAKKFTFKDTTKAKPTVVKSLKENELDEAISTIQTLRNELNEVNLLNAKLLYVNKLFKANSLTESQKVKVIASFDKATNVKEAKAVFETLQETLKPVKKAIKESLGFASKAAGVAPKKTIVESNDVITRMQKLANIIK